MTELFKIVVKERLIVWDLLGNLSAFLDGLLHTLFCFIFYQWLLLL